MGARVHWRCSTCVPWCAHSTRHTSPEKGHGRSQWMEPLPNLPHIFPHRIRLLPNFRPKRRCRYPTRGFTSTCLRIRETSSRSTRNCFSSAPPRESSNVMAHHHPRASKVRLPISSVSTSPKEETSIDSSITTSKGGWTPKIYSGQSMIGFRFLNCVCVHACHLVVRDANAFQTDASSTRRKGRLRAARICHPRSSNERQYVTSQCHQLPTSPETSSHRAQEHSLR